MKSSVSVKLSLRKRLLWKKEHHFIITRTSNTQNRTATFKKPSHLCLAYATILLSRQMPYIVRRCVKNSYGEIKVLSE